MNHRHKRHRTIFRIHKKFKNLAAAVAGTAILSGAMLAGLPAAPVYASADPLAGKNPIKVTQQIDQQKQMSNAKKVSLNNEKSPSNYQQVLNVKATAYAPGAHDNGKWGNKTYTGEQIRPGIIAVDPKVIPLGSRVYIEYPDGRREYAVAADTGGAIKGNRIDVAKWSVGEAKKFGIKNVKVYVVDTPAEEI